VVRWVHEHLTYELTPTALSTLEILERRRGDCKAYSALTVALLRALGVPAQLEEGLLAMGDVLGAHAWVRYHDGTGVREIDPTSNQLVVGSGHIPLSVADVVGLVASQRLRVVEVRPERDPGR
jgi:transglutaminase-like putative cysteine protease